MSSRYERYRGFELCITYLPKCEIEVVAVRQQYPQVAYYCKSLSDVRKEIDLFWKERGYAEDKA